MLVEMTGIWASPTRQARPGDIVEVDDDVAKQLINNRNAKPYVAKEKPKPKKKAVKRGRFGRDVGSGD